MKTYQRALVYLTVAVGLSGTACEKQPSQLEQAVQAQGLPISGTPKSGRLVSPEPRIEQELDLSTPESCLKSHARAYNNQDFDLMDKIVAKGSPYEKLVAKARQKGKVSESEHRTISEIQILETTRVSPNVTVLHMRATVKNKVLEGEVTVVYDEAKWKYFDSTR